ncbi:MAG: DUF2304 domain-containing protein [Clostridia bacterium]|nr:DUF2304 domain-containing protein [Clostridia bacterium]
MSTLQIVLLAVSLITVAILLLKIKKSQFLIGDSIFWLLLSLVLAIVAIFPKVPSYFSKLLGFESPSNFIFVVFIFLLLVKIFSLNLQLTKLETKLQKLVSKIALDSKDKNE